MAFNLLPRQIAVRFNFDAEADLPSYTDTLFFGVDEYSKLTPKQVEAACRARYDAWAAQIRNPPTPEPAPEVDALDAAQAALDAADQASDKARDVLQAARDAKQTKADAVAAKAVTAKPRK